MSDKPLGLIHDCSHLRKLILDNPRCADSNNGA